MAALPTLSLAGLDSPSTAPSAPFSSGAATSLAPLRSPLRATTGSLGAGRLTARSLGDTVLHHEWSHEVSAARASRKTAEADAAALAARIALLQEHEERARRALQRTRHRAVEAEAFRAERGLPAALPSLTYDATALPYAPAATGGRRLYGDRPATTLLTHRSAGSFDLRLASPVRTAVPALPPLQAHTAARAAQTAAIRDATAFLRQTVEEAAATERAVVAAALRAAKDSRLAEAATARAAIAAQARALHDAGVAWGMQARTRRLAAETAAAETRGAAYATRLEAEHAAHADVASRVAQLEALEAALVARIRGAPDLKVSAALTTPLAAGLSLPSPHAAPPSTGSRTFTPAASGAFRPDTVTARRAPSAAPTFSTATIGPGGGGNPLASPLRAASVTPAGRARHAHTAPSYVEF